MFEKRLKAVDLAKGTKIAPSVISRYLSGKNQPSTDNIMTIGNYLGVQPQWLLSSSDAPESIQKSKNISSATEPLLKQVELQTKLINNLEIQIVHLEKQIVHLEKQIKNLEEAKTESKERHTKKRGRTKKPTKPN